MNEYARPTQTHRVYLYEKKIWCGWNVEIPNEPNSMMNEPFEARINSWMPSVRCLYTVYIKTKVTKIKKKKKQRGISCSLVLETSHKRKQQIKNKS